MPSTHLENIFEKSEWLGVFTCIPNWTRMAFSETAAGTLPVLNEM